MEDPGPWRSGATSAHAVDVQLPAGVGLGGATVSLKAGSASFLGTLFVDSQDNIPAINQATYLVSASATTAPANASTLSLLVITQAGQYLCADRTDPFVTQGAGGTGTGVVTVSLAANSAPPARRPSRSRASRSRSRKLAPPIP